MAENQLIIDLLINDKEALSKLKGALKEVEAGAKTSSREIASGFIQAEVIIQSVEKAFQLLVGIMKESVGAALDQENAINKLNNALRLQGTFSQALSVQYQNMATEMQQNSVFADEAILNVMRTLTTVGQVGPAAMKKSTQAVLDLAVALDTDLDSAASVVAKASAGMTTALTRQFPILKGLITETTSYSDILDILSKKLGGSAQANLDSFGNASKKMANQMNEVQEALGRLVTESPEVKEFITFLTRGLEDLARVLNMKQTQDAFRTFLLGTAKNAIDAAMAVQSLAIGVQRFIEAWTPGGTEKSDMMMADLEAMVNKSDELTARINDIKAHANDMPVIDLGTVSAPAGPDTAAADAARALEIQTFVEGELEKVNQARLVWDMWNNEKTQKYMAMVQNETDFFNFATQTQKLASQSMWVAMGKERDAFSAGVSGMFKSMIRGTFDAGEAFKQLGLTMVDILIDQGVQMLVNSLIAKAINAGYVATAAVTGKAVALAWASAAANVSLATAGANAPPAIAGMTAAHVSSVAQSAVPGLAEGGDVARAGAVLVGERGPEFLNLPAGARVTPLEKAGRGDININIDIHNPIMTTEEATRTIAKQLASEISQFIENERERL